MRHRPTLLLRSFLFLLASLTLTFKAKAQYDAAAPEPQPPLKGTLVLHGGGVVSDDIRKRFTDIAGGNEARIVVIPTADTSDPLNEKKILVWKPHQPKSIELLHAETHEQAMDGSLSKILEEATGVWFSGGKQTKLTEIYANSPVETRLHALLARGGVIGGTSAGTAIATKEMLVFDEERTGFDFLPGVIVDQHFLKKNRSERLQRAITKHPDRVGLGIDEGTALIVRGRSLEVIGDSTVSVCLAPSSLRPLRFESLQPGGRADLIALRRAAVSRASQPFPNTPAPKPLVEKGSLVIVGGGSMPERVLKTFIKLAGGENASILYIPCTEEEKIEGEPSMVATFLKAGAGQAGWLHTKDRKLADDPSFTLPLSKATGIWFGGGRQWNLVDSYLDTEAHRLMHEVLDRGGVIGGSSAGASIQGDYMPRGNPLGNLDIMAEGYERGLGFLRGVAIDQHFAQRNRFRDMASLKRTFPQLLGIGIDEGTALVVQGQQAEVMGPGKVAFFDRTEGDNEIEAYDRFAEGIVYDLVKRAPVER